MTREPEAVARWKYLYDDYDAGTVFITDDPEGDQKPIIVQSFDLRTARLIVDAHNAALARQPAALRDPTTRGGETPETMEALANQPAAEGLNVKRLDSAYCWAMHGGEHLPPKGSGCGSYHAKAIAAEYARLASQPAAEGLDVERLALAVHEAFGADAPGGCDHTPVRICYEYAVEIADTYTRLAKPTEDQP